MKTLPRDQANVVWDELWDAMKSEWFKVEVLQDYSAEDKGESLSAWMAGDKELSIELLRGEPNPWTDSCREKVESGENSPEFTLLTIPFQIIFNGRLRYIKAVIFHLVKKIYI